MDKRHEIQCAPLSAGFPPGVMSVWCSACKAWVDDLTVPWEECPAKADVVDRTEYRCCPTCGGRKMVGIRPLGKWGLTFALQEPAPCPLCNATGKVPVLAENECFALVPVKP